MITLNAFLIGIPLFIMAVVMHELAHLFTARFFKLESRLGLLGIMPCVYHMNFHTLTKKQVFCVTMAPIPFSFVYLFLFMLIVNYTNYMAYGGFAFWILFAVGFGIFGTYIGSRSDIKMFMNYKEKKYESKIST